MSPSGHEANRHVTLSGGDEAPTVLGAIGAAQVPTRPHVRSSRRAYRSSATPVQCLPAPVRLVVSHICPDDYISAIGAG